MGIFAGFVLWWYLETLRNEPKRAAGSASPIDSGEENAGPLLACNRKKGLTEVDIFKARLQVYGARAAT